MNSSSCEVQKHHSGGHWKSAAFPGVIYTGTHNSVCLRACGELHTMCPSQSPQNSPSYLNKINGSKQPVLIDLYIKTPIILEEVKCSPTCRASKALRNTSRHTMRTNMAATRVTDCYCFAPARPRLYASESTKKHQTKKCVTILAAYKQFRLRACFPADDDGSNLSSHDKKHFPL
ncbi:hypothetical protein Y032_0550g3312 [Ancylostoma ceylanicum]|uniref:Uncharacterized protein n=1 Tax=Ancylostoma ceylanicum TaxID=53326 RepID=A0A016WQL6_9BILA|nr:hypothetical protein Y032_0550g3312 [Ancylostoma ceylanicum]